MYPNQLDRFSLATCLQGLALAALFSGAVACAAPTGEADQAGPASPTSSSEDEIKKATPLCDEGALASERLQPRPKGGPDARKHVTCEAGYKLCRIDPKGSNSDTCSSPTDCYACPKPACVQQVACAKYTHFNPSTCTCEENACLQVSLCTPTTHFDRGACKCVAGAP